MEAPLVAPARQLVVEELRYKVPQQRQDYHEQQHDDEQHDKARFLSVRRLILGSHLQLAIASHNGVPRLIHRDLNFVNHLTLLGDHRAHVGHHVAERHGLGRDRCRLVKAFLQTGGENGMCAQSTSVCAARCALDAVHAVVYAPFTMPRQLYMHACTDLRNSLVYVSVRL